MSEREYFIGKIVSQQKKKVYNKNSIFCGQIYYKLTIANYSQKSIVFAYANLLSQALWSLIELKNYQSPYLFTVLKRKRRLILLDFQARD